MRFNQPAGDQRSDKRPHVDAHIEQREAAVAARIAFLVQRTDHHRNTGFEQAGTEHDKHQADKEQAIPHHRRQRDGEMAEGDKNRAVPDRLLLPEPVIRQPAAGQRGKIHGPRKDPDNGRRVLARQPHPAVIDGGRHKQDQ